MKITNYIPIDTIIASIQLEVGQLEGINELSLVEWAADALDFIGAPAQYEEAVDNIEVDNYKAAIPCGLQKIIQIAYKKTEGCPTETPLCSLSSSQDSTDPCDTCSDDDDCTDTSDSSPCDTTNKLLCEYYIGGYKWSTMAKTPYYTQNYGPLRLATTTMRTKSLHCDGCDNLTCEAVDTYDIHPPYIHTSFQTGYICLAYLRYPLDERGWPMIPDEVSYREAIKKFIIMKLMYSRYLRKEEGTRTLYKELEQDWQWYCGQARAKAYQPGQIDEFQNLLDTHRRLIPKTYRYYGFFGNMALPEFYKTSGVN